MWRRIIQLEDDVVWAREGWSLGSGTTTLGEEGIGEKGIGETAMAAEFVSIINSGEKLDVLLASAMAIRGIVGKLVRHDPFD